jgi:hypothetical protein
MEMAVVGVVQLVVVVERAMALAIISSGVNARGGRRTAITS